MVTKSISPGARVLVIHVARIGDTLLITPMLHALKQVIPRGRLKVLAHPARREVLDNLPFIDELGTITPKTAWYRGRFGGHRWDVAIVYGQDEPLIRYAARIADRVVAFEQRSEMANRLLWKSVKPPNALHAVQERLMLAAALGIETNDYRLAYAPTAAELTTAHTWINQYAPDAQPLVGFQVSSFPTKRYRDWPLDHFAEIGRRLLAQHPRTRILIFGDGASRKHADTLACELGASVVPAAGGLSIRETAALMTYLDLYLGVDTGPTHLAGALRVPMVAMYHCRHRGQLLAPLQHEHLRVIEHPATDSECADIKPMSDISVNQVWTAAQSLLSAQTP